CCTTVSARVTFEKAEVIDHGDLKNTKKVGFACRVDCRVYTPTSTDYLKIIDQNDKLITTFTDLFKVPVKTPLELQAGNYFVNSMSAGNLDFMLYVVQKDADNYNSLVYNNLLLNTDQQIDATNQRFVTMITDLQGFRVFGLSGDLDKAKPSLYAVGADSVAKCRPVFSAISRDNAERTSFTISGPIGTVDFGTDQGIHMVTIGSDYYTPPSTSVGTSTVVVSPGFVGCLSTGNQMYTNEHTLNKDLPKYTINNPDGILPLKLNADYSIQSAAAAVEI
ncbi:hypothetical protein PFISCL1PPCAC_11619, partial [Pristionchus fissidentatus]